MWKMEADGNKAESRERERDDRNQQVGDGSRQTGRQAAEPRLWRCSGKTNRQALSTSRIASAGRLLADARFPPPRGRLADANWVGAPQLRTGWRSG